MQDGDVMGLVDASERMNIMRLTSSAKAVQRVCGAFLTKDVDPKLVAFMDTPRMLAEAGVSNHIEGRTETMYATSYGIFKGRLYDVDDMSKFERIFYVPEPAIWMYKYRNVILAYFQLYGFAVSVDGGETFTYIDNIMAKSPIMTTIMFCGIYDGRIAIGNSYIVELKNE